MHTPMMIIEEIAFKANKDTVWNLITNPKMTKKYMFGCEVISNWEIGSPIEWKTTLDNNMPITYVKGTIIKYSERDNVSFTMFDPTMGIPDIPENYITLSYQIIEKETGCLLKITQGDFQNTENAVKRFEESKQGWQMVIPLMKKLLDA